MRGVAVDAGKGLAARLRVARGAAARDDDWLTFKRCVLTALGDGADTVLLDAECGPMLLGDYPSGCTPTIAYEADAYRIAEPDRITVLPDHLRVADFPGLGIPQLKFFMYYAPEDSPDLNRRKQDIVARIGADCARHNVAFLFEPLVFDRCTLPGSGAYARLKPELVSRTTEVFADPRFNVTMLKVEIPVDLAYVNGFGEDVLSHSQAESAFRNAAAAAQGLPLVYLSAGMPFGRFEASLAMARSAGVPFSGFMCGRALWSDAIPVFGHGGVPALRGWLDRIGRSRLERLIRAAER